MLDRRQLALWRGRVSAEFAVGNLTRAFRDVLLALGEFHSAKRGIFPAQATLAKHARCSVPTVQRALTMGRKLGLIDWQAQWRRAGWRQVRSSNRYTLLLPGTPITRGLRPKAPPRITHQMDRGEGKHKDSRRLAHQKALDDMLREDSAVPDLLTRRRQALPGILVAARQQRMAESLRR